MSTFSNRDLYRAAIIGGLLASGEYSLAELEKYPSLINRVIREYAGDLHDTQYPEGVPREEAIAAECCLYDFLSEPRTLSRVIAHLMQLGFSEQVARYTYGTAIEFKQASLSVDGGLPILTRVEVLS